MSLPPAHHRLSNHLNHDLSSSAGYSTSWFRPVEKSAQDRYGKICTDMILFCIGLAQGEFGDYSRSVSPSEKSAVDGYIAVLGSGEEESEALALQRLLWALFTHDRRRSPRCDLTVYRFLILYSFRREGHLAKASVITQYISGIVFIGRTAILNEIKKSMDRKNRGFFT